MRTVTATPLRTRADLALTRLRPRGPLRIRGGRTSFLPATGDFSPAQLRRRRRRRGALQEVLRTL